MHQSLKEFTLRRLRGPKGQVWAAVPPMEFVPASMLIAFVFSRLQGSGNMGCCFAGPSLDGLTALRPYPLAHPKSTLSQQRPRIVCEASMEALGLTPWTKGAWGLAQESGRAALLDALQRPLLRRRGGRRRRDIRGAYRTDGGRVMYRVRVHEYKYNAKALGPPWDDCSWLRVGSFLT